MSEDKPANKKVNYVRNQDKPPFEMSQYDKIDYSKDAENDPTGEPYDDLAPDMRAILDREPPVPEGAPRLTANGSTVVISQPNVYKIGPKRTLTERESDLVLIAKWYLEGLNHHQIAERLSSLRNYTIKRQQITNTIHEIYKRWKISFLSDFNTLKVRELARIDKLEAEYWDAWEKSKEPKLEVEQIVASEDVLPKGKNNGQTVSVGGKKTTTRKSQRDPNFMYLAGIQWCINKRCEIFGLNAPREANVNFNWRQEAERAGIDNPDEIIDGIANEFLAIARSSDTRSLESGAEKNQTA